MFLSPWADLAASRIDWRKNELSWGGEWALWAHHAYRRLADPTVYSAAFSGRFDSMVSCNLEIRQEFVFSSFIHTFNGARVCVRTVAGDAMVRWLFLFLISILRRKFASRLEFSLWRNGVSERRNIAGAVLVLIGQSLRADENNVYSSASQQMDFCFIVNRTLTPACGK